MVSYKVVIGNKDGKSVQKELSDEHSNSLVGKKIGDKISGNDIGFEGYEFEITGGSDKSGTPMRKDAGGQGKRKVLCVSGVGVSKKRHGQKQRKTVCGRRIFEGISQVNLKIVKMGKASVFEKKEESGEAKEGEKKSEEKKEEKKEEAKPKEDRPVESKQEEKKEEKDRKAEEKKEEAKPEESKQEEKKDEEKAEAK